MTLGKPDARERIPVRPLKNNLSLFIAIDAVGNSCGGAAPICN